MIHVASTPPELDEAILALKALGYSEKEVQKVAKTLETESLTTEQYIKKALQMMLKVRGVVCNGGENC